MAVLLSAADWADAAFQLVFIERLVNQAPMALVGLILMLIGSRIDHPERIRTPIRWVVCVLSSLLTIAMIASFSISLTNNQTFSGKAKETITQIRKQLDEARSQSEDENYAKEFGEQLQQAGQLPKAASNQDKIDAGKRFFAQQLPRMEEAANDQIQLVEKESQRAQSKNLLGGTASSTVLAIAFILLALACVL